MSVGKSTPSLKLKPCTRVTYFRLVNYTEQNIATRLNTAFQILLAQAQPADGTRGTLSPPTVEIVWDCAALPQTSKLD